MPSRFNPISPPDHRNQRYQNHPNSPTQSYVSTATTYEQPWSSPKFQAPATPRDDQPRFRRTHSMAAKKFGGGGGQKGVNEKSEEDQKSDRPKINFMELGKKFTNKFKKNKNRNNDQRSIDRLSAPIIKLGDTPSTSQPQLQTTASPSPTKKKNAIKGSTSMKMQPEDRMKMFQKMGREQAMKVSNVQRMQRERQRDFSLVPGPGRACLEANPGSSHSIDSMLVFNTTPDSRRSTSLSMTDDDVEPVFKNSLTNKNITSAQFKCQQKLSSGPSFTSTPRLMGNTSLQADSPTISNVRSMSNSSFCLLTSDDTTVNRADSTMYFSADTLNAKPPNFRVPKNIPERSMNDVSLASTASTPTATSSSVTSSGATSSSTSSNPPVSIKKVKQEIVENEDQSNYPSFSSPTPTSDLESLTQNQQKQLQMQQNNQPEHLNVSVSINLWVVSKEIRDNQLQLERALPHLETMRNRAMAIDQQKMLLLESKGDNPSNEDMRRLWDLDREFVRVNTEMSMASMAISNANQLLPFLEMRRNELLSLSPPPQVSSQNNFQTGSFV
ncbi:hypothetical protein CRE_18469 [Caenorhabditis remanei]|uniref:Uncharacterized protein n=1 Tax=Caenorhabditis remanei TaxID=31234 RepID=E3LKP1_CAERE|nr:hypothetical protein CRE_18469 [Caenorhabditis remanei]